MHRQFCQINPSLIRQLIKESEDRLLIVSLDVQ